MATGQVLERSKQKNGSSSKVADRKEDVEKLAYQYYVERGCVDGCDREDWLKAEAVIQQRTSR